MEKALLTEATADRVFSEILKILNNGPLSLVEFDFAGRTDKVEDLRVAIATRNKVQENTFKDFSFEGPNESGAISMAVLAITEPTSGDQTATHLQWGDTEYWDNDSGEIIVFEMADKELMEYEGDPIDILEVKPEAKLGSLVYIKKL